jgi:transcriptional regulator with XRE-family HTH domain
MAAPVHFTPSTVPEHVGAWLRDLRLTSKPKWSQPALARELGVSQNTVSRWERGQSCPTVAEYLTICRLLHAHPGANLDRIVSAHAHTMPLFGDMRAAPAVEARNG